MDRWVFRGWDKGVSETEAKYCLGIATPFFVAEYQKRSNTWIQI